MGLPIPFGEFISGSIVKCGTGRPVPYDINFKFAIEKLTAKQTKNTGMRINPLKQRKAPSRAVVFLCLREDLSR